MVKHNRLVVTCIRCGESVTLGEALPSRLAPDGKLIWSRTGTCYHCDKITGVDVDPATGEPIIQNS